MPNDDMTPLEAVAKMIDAVKTLKDIEALQKRIKRENEEKGAVIINELYLDTHALFTKLTEEASYQFFHARYYLTGDRPPLYQTIPSAILEAVDARNK